MKIVVIGGTGLIGARLVGKLVTMGLDVLSASPQSGINTLTMAGLSNALRNADVVVDVSNSPSTEGQAALDFFQRSTMNLVTAEAYAGVKHHIALSIVGADRSPESGYLRAKLFQEELIRESGIPYSILRSTQFFELADRIADDATNGSEVHISPAAFQPIASEEVVAALSKLIFSDAVNTISEVAGPVQMPMYDFMRYYLTGIEDSRQVIEDPHARYFGVELTDQSLVPGDNPQLGSIMFEDWFHNQLLRNEYVS